MQLQKTSTFSIVVPLFNEEENIEPLVESLLDTVGDDAGFLELILVDDGSLDDTARLALDLAAKEQRIRLIKHEKNKGLGGAIRTGLEASSGDYVLYTDADLPFDFKELPKLFSMAQDNCLVTGYRLNRGEGGRRWVLTKGYNALIWLLFGLRLQDVNFACKIFPKSFLQKTDFYSSGSFIDVEILLEASRLDLDIIEHPLVYYPRERGLSTLSRPEVIFFILKEMYTYIVRLFLDQSTLGAVFNMSPLVKFVIFAATVATSIALFFQFPGDYQGGTGLLLTVETGIISLLLGWRAAIISVVSVLGTVAFCSLWQGHLNNGSYNFLIWTILGVVFHEVGIRSWKFIQESGGLKASE